MTAPTLKKYMGEGGAGLDDSTGQDNLHDVLAAMAAAGRNLDAYQAAIAAATIGGCVADADGVLDNLRTLVGTCGTAGSTTAQVHVNGVSKGELTTAHDAADGIKKSLDLNVAISAGDLIELVVSAAPTDGADLVASAHISPVVVES